MPWRCWDDMAAAETTAQSALHVINEQLQEAIDAPKCHRCGCLQQTVEALAQTEAGKGELAAMLTQARSVFVPEKIRLPRVCRVLSGNCRQCLYRSLPEGGRRASIFVRPRTGRT